MAKERQKLKAYYVEVWANGYIAAENRSEVLSKIKNAKVSDLKSVILDPTVNITACREEFYDEFIKFNN